MMSLGMPTLTPRDTQSLWYTPSHTFGYTVPPRPSSIIQNPAPQTQHTHDHRYRAQRDASRSALSQFGPSALQQLTIDEEAVEKRKLHIARFGATWIRPPGMMKTLQGVIDEELERAEQLALEETTVDEGGLAGMNDVNMVGGEPVDIVEDGDEEEGEAGDVEADDEEEEVGEGEEGLMEEEEVDLDADIPEADSGGWSEEEEEDEEEEEEEEEDEEEGGDEGSGIEVEVEDDEVEVDLDDDIPEAEISVYEEEESDGEEEEEVHELSAIAETTVDSIDESYVSEVVGDGSPQPITPLPTSQRNTPPVTGRRGTPVYHQHGLRRQHHHAGGSSPSTRQPPPAPVRGGRRFRTSAADSSALFGDEMEVDD